MAPRKVDLATEIAQIERARAKRRASLTRQLAKLGARGRSGERGLWLLVGSIMDDPRSHLALSFASARSFLRATFPDLKPRTIAREVLVARTFDGAAWTRYSHNLLEEIARYAEAKGLRARPGRPLDPTKIELAFRGADGRMVRCDAITAPVSLVRRASRASRPAARTRRNEPERVVAVRELLRTRPALRVVGLRVSRGYATFSMVPLDALEEFAHVMAASARAIARI